MSDDRRFGYRTEQGPSIESVFRDEELPRYGYRTLYPNGHPPCGYRTADASKDAQRRRHLRLVATTGQKGS